MSAIITVGVIGALSLWLVNLNNQIALIKSEISSVASNISTSSQPSLSTTSASENTANSTKEYTDPNFPDLKLTFGTDWNTSVSETDDSPFVGDSYVNKVIISKTNSTLTLDLGVSSAFGWGTQCYRKDAITAVELSNGWVRLTVDDRNYTYTKSLTMATEANRSEIEGYLDAYFLPRANFVLYVACGAGGIGDSAMATKSNFTNALDDDGDRMMSAALNINARTMNAADLAEIDAMVTGGSF